MTPRSKQLREELAHVQRLGGDPHRCESLHYEIQREAELELQSAAQRLREKERAALDARPKAAAQPLLEPDEGDTRMATEARREQARLSNVNPMAAALHAKRFAPVLYANHTPQGEDPKGAA